MTEQEGYYDRGVVAYRRILVVLDARPESERALDHALALAEDLHAEIRGVVVEGRLPRYAGTVGEVEEARWDKDLRFFPVLERAEALAEAKGIEFEVELRPGTQAQAASRLAAEHGSDLIVVGHRPGLLGSTAWRLCRSAPCPVLVVR